MYQSLAVHATEMKHDDRFHFHWYFTIITLVAILLTILICNGYPYLLRNLLYRICCTKQPVVNPTLGDKSQSLPETFPEEQPCTSQLQFNEKEKKVRVCHLLCTNRGLKLSLPGDITTNLKGEDRLLLLLRDPQESEKSRNPERWRKA